MSYRFRFVPLSPTQEAWTNRAFSDYPNADALFTALREKEAALGKFKYLGGYIRFKKGFYAEYKDGTEAKVYNNPRWWKTGARSCCMGCCTTLPPGQTYENTEPAQIVPKAYQRSWQEFKRTVGLGGAHEQYKEITNKGSIEKIELTGIGWFYVEHY